MAINLPIFAVKPVNPDLTFKHISVHVVHILARMIAKEAIKAQLRNEGVRSSSSCQGRLMNAPRLIFTTIQRSGRKRWQGHIGSMRQKDCVRPDRNCVGKNCANARHRSIRIFPVLPKRAAEPGLATCTGRLSSREPQSKNRVGKEAAGNLGN